MAHAITALRLLLTIPLLLAIRGGYLAPPPWTAPFLFGLIAVSDVVDGRVARARGSVSPWGRRFDHGADIIFVLSTFVAYAATGTVGWWVPASIAVAFSAYVIDARSDAPFSRARQLAARTGHIGGVSNYVVIGVLVCNNTLGLHWLPPLLLQLIVNAVPLYSLAPVMLRWLPGATGERSTLSVG